MSLKPNEIYYLIREDIMNGSLLPGVHLVESELQSKYSVSRNTIRDALRLIVNDGLAELIPYHGVIVRKYTIQEIKYIWTIKEYLDGLAARLVAESGDASSIKELQSIVKENALYVFDENPYLYVKADMRFHDLFIESTKNPILIEELRRFNTIVMINTFLTPLLQTAHYERSQRCHEKLIDAFLAHDGDLAEAIVRKHIRDSSRLIVERTTLQQ